LFKNKKILVLVPARAGSKGIKNKNLRLVNKKPLIEYTFDFANQLSFVDLKIVSTDSINILNLAKKKQFIGIKRSKILAGDKVSDYKVIRSIIDNKIVIKSKCDYLIYLQPTSPIRKKKELVFALKEIINKNYSSAWSVSKINKKNHPLKVLAIKNQKLKLYYSKGRHIIARQQLDDLYIRNGVFYIFRIKDLKKYKSIYLNKTLPIKINHNIINIDSLNDLQVARNFFEKKK
jgi:CMP-N,N'-diacetyllegionaminic acid synthase